MYELAALPDVLPELPALDEAFDAGGHVQHHQVLPRASEWRGSCCEAEAHPWWMPPPLLCLAKACQLAVISSILEHLAHSLKVYRAQRGPYSHHAGFQRSLPSQVTLPGSSALLGMPPICAPMTALPGAQHKHSRSLVSAFGGSGGAAPAAKRDPFTAGFGGSNSSSPVCPMTGQRPGGMVPPQLPPPEHFPPALQALAEQQRLFMQRKYQEQVYPSELFHLVRTRCAAEHMRALRSSPRQV